MPFASISCARQNLHNQPLERWRPLQETLALRVSLPAMELLRRQLGQWQATRYVALCSGYIDRFYIIKWFLISHTGHVARQLTKGLFQSDHQNFLRFTPKGWSLQTFSSGIDVLVRMLTNSDTV